MRKKIIMNKQIYVPRQLREEPLYRLSGVEDLASSGFYTVTADGCSERVYHNEFFDFVCIVREQPQTLLVEVTVHDVFQSVRIRPGSSNICWSAEGNVVRFELKEMQRAVLEIDGDLERPLYLLPSVRVPKPEAAAYEFLRGKAYNIGCLELNSGDTVYIEEGAVVSGRIFSRMADRIHIAGNGILYGGNWHAWDENGAEQLIVCVLGRDIRVEGITLLDGGSWHLVPVACRGVRIENVNILGKVITGDGLDIVGCEDVEVRNCFIRANDDCISIKAEEFQDPSGCADVKRILVEDCLFWNAEFGNALEIGYETRCGEISDVTFRNCEIIHCQYEGNQSGGVLTIHNADRAWVHDIRYENIRIEDAQEKLIDIKTLDSKYSRDRKRGMVNDIYFKNIEVTGGDFPVSIIRGFEMADEVCRPHGFHFENVTIHGKRICSANELRMVVELADDLRFV